MRVGRHLASMRSILSWHRCYYYRVRAVKSGSPTVYSTYSNTASARTLKR